MSGGTGFAARGSDGPTVSGRRSVPSFIEARPPLVTNPWLRPQLKHATNLLHLYEDESLEEPACTAESDLLQVYLRMKPNNEPNTLYDIRSDKLLAMSSDLQASEYNRKTQCNVSKIYTFSHIFRADTSQKEMFEDVVKENLKRLPDGNSYTLLTYGASGSGKTYTLMGTVAEPGLVPRSLEYLFKIINPAQHPQYRPRDGGHETLSPAQQAQELQLVSRLRHPTAPVRGARRAYKRMSVRLSGDFHSATSLLARNTHFVWVSFIEIYNEAVYDLLQPVDRSKAAVKLKICEDPRGIVYVKGATQAFVRTGAEAYDVMVAGKMNLRVAATGVHAQSSRSHCIFTITLLSATPDGVISSCVRLCDLAGSERAERTQNAGVRMTESRAINSSLHVLERCLYMLRRKQRAGNAIDMSGANLLVPFRESKLTRLLGAPLSGASCEAVSMVVTVNPSRLYAQETRHVLQLAAVASDICVNTTTVDRTYAGIETSTDSKDSSDRESMNTLLRAENERLLIENERLYKCLERANRSADSNREEAAATMEELVEEAKDMMRVYSNQQIALLEERHRAEIQMYKQQFEKMVLEITRLKDQLNSQPLKHAVVESEIDHLHACLAERDQAVSEPNADQGDSQSQSVVVLDSDSGSDDDSDSECDHLPLDSIPEEILNRSLAKAMRSFDEDRTKSCDDRHTGASAETQYSDSETDESSDDELDNPINISNTGKESNKNNRLHKSSDIDLSIESFAHAKDISNSNNEQRNITAEDNPNYDFNDPEYDNDINSLKNIDDHNNVITSEDGNIYNKYSNNSAEREGFERNDIQINSNSVKNKESLVTDNMKKSQSGIEIERFSIACTVSSTNTSNLRESLTQEFAKGNDLVNHSISEESINENDGMANIKKNPEIAKILPEQNIEIISYQNLSADGPASIIVVDPKAVEQSKSTETISRYLNDDVSKIQNENEIANSITFTQPAAIEANENKLDMDSSNNITNIACSDDAETFSKTISMSNATNNQTLDDISLPNLSDIEIKNENKKNLFTNTVEITLAEQQTFLSQNFLTKTTSIDIFDCQSDKLTFPTLEILIPVVPLKGNYPENMTQVLPTGSMTGALESNKENSLSVHSNKSVKEILSLCRPKSDEIQKLDKIEKETCDVNKSSNNKEMGSVTRTENIHEISEIQTSKESEHNIVTPYIEKVQIALEAKESFEFSKYDNCKETGRSCNMDLLNNVEGEKDTFTQEKTEKEKSSSQAKERISRTSSEFEPQTECNSDTTLEFAPINELRIQTRKNTAAEDLIVAYNLRKRAQDKKNLLKNDDIEEKTSGTDFKCDLPSKLKSSRMNLRKTRQKTFHADGNEEVEIEDTEDNCYAKPKSKDRNKKLKDIANLQSESSDVKGTPCIKNTLKDMGSPERKAKGEENIPPHLMETQSCPMKSVGRRKLFTPRAEPLDDSVPSDNEGASVDRLRIPRPSYHRTTRARRKL